MQKAVTIRIGIRFSIIIVLQCLFYNSVKEDEEVPCRHSTSVTTEVCQRNCSYFATKEFTRDLAARNIVTEQEVCKVYYMHT